MRPTEPDNDRPVTFRPLKYALGTIALCAAVIGMLWLLWVLGLIPEP